MRRARCGFTIVELLVVIAIISVLIAILLPALGAARQRARIAACGSQLRQLGVGMTLYLEDHDRALPQAAYPPVPGAPPRVIGSLFGGKAGRLPFFGLNQVGISGRPLNPYVGLDVSRLVPEDERIEALIYRSPLDRGAEDTGIPMLEYARTDSMYDLVGSSYALNDHALDDDPQVERWNTLIPPWGGRMPAVMDETRTWVLASHPIYNYDSGGDRRSRWHQRDQERANALYLDMHVGLSVAVPSPTGGAPINTTDEYTFLPSPDWIERYPW